MKKSFLSDDIINLMRYFLPVFLSHIWLSAAPSLSQIMHEDAGWMIIGPCKRNSISLLFRIKLVEIKNMEPRITIIDDFIIILGWNYLNHFSTWNRRIYWPMASWLYAKNGESLSIRLEHICLNSRVEIYFVFKSFQINVLNRI